MRSVRQLARERAIFAGVLVYALILALGYGVRSLRQIGGSL